MLTQSGRMMGHGEADPAAIQRYESQLRECLDLYENILSRSDYLTGNVSRPPRAVSLSASDLIFSIIVFQPRGSVPCPVASFPISARFERRACFTVSCQ